MDYKEWQMWLEVEKLDNENVRLKKELKFESFAKSHETQMALCYCKSHKKNRDNVSRLERIEELAVQIVAEFEVMKNESDNKDLFDAIREMEELLEKYKKEDDR